MHRKPTKRDRNAIPDADPVYGKMPPAQLSENHPQRRGEWPVDDLRAHLKHSLGPNGRTFTLDRDLLDHPRVAQAIIERRTDFSTLRAKGALLRRILLYAAFGALVGASVAILVAWMRQ